MRDDTRAPRRSGIGVFPFRVADQEQLNLALPLFELPVMGPAITVPLRLFSHYTAGRDSIMRPAARLDATMQLPEAVVPIPDPGFPDEPAWIWDLPNDGQFQVAIEGSFTAPSIWVLERGKNAMLVEVAGHPMQVALEYMPERQRYQARVRGYLDEYTLFDAMASTTTESERAEIVACIATLNVQALTRYEV